MPSPSVPQFPDRAVAITPSDTTYLVPTTVYVGGAGNATVEPAVGGGTVVFTGLTVGSVIPVRVVRVLAATTATLLVGVS